jgi:LuxR family transcriptional regulator, maltose regulon positive regulatory protein
MSDRPVLVATKLHVPELRADLVPRPELVARLIAADAKLILICAPAGWGKSILLSAWCASPQEKRGFAWVSLDRGDSDPVRFWSYVIEALRTVRATIGDSALAALPNAGPDVVDVVVAPLMNDLAAFSEPVVLVLDDYHLVHSEAVHDSVAFLLRHLPHNVQVAIASRADPPLPLASLRAAGEVTEVRAAELRFSDAEAEALLNDSLGLDLDRSQVESLQARTEGWAAGLRLAGLSVQAQSDRLAFIEEFAGDDRQIGDYLHEVLDDQPAGLRTFLLRTSILERMSPPLCNVLTGARDAAVRLAEVERSNLFLIPLDSHREWYRYHHLFRDLLRHELAHDDPKLVSELHRRAAHWHREEGDVDEAIAHAAAAGDFAEAAELIAQYWRRFVFHLGQVETAARWLDSVPPEFVMNDPRLCLARGWIAALFGRHDEVFECLRAAESCPPAPGPLYAVASSSDSAVAQLRATHALLCGDVERSKDAARRAVELEPDRSSLARAVAQVLLGASLYFTGEVAEAEAALAAGLLRLREDEWRTAAVISGLGYRAAIYAERGQLERGQHVAAEADELIQSWQHGEGAWAAPAFHARGRLLERGGDLAAADAAFGQAVRLARRGGRRLDVANGLISTARLKGRSGEHEVARSLVREARAVLDLCPDPGILQELLGKTERALQLTTSRRTETVLPVDVELSERELTILRLLASELSQREIGRELYISLNTVKGHVRSVFRKLGVATRAEAVTRARELSLI